MAEELDRVRIFISHRPADTAGHVRGLQEALSSRFGREQVSTFADVARAEPGSPVSALIERAVTSADVVVLVMGANWLTAPDETGHRLDDPADRPRRELELAFARNVTVIPVLVEGAEMPRADQLPEPLRGLLGFQAVSVTDSTPTAFEFGVNRLVDSINDLARRKTEDAQAEREAAAERARREAEQQQPARWEPTPAPVEPQRPGQSELDLLLQAAMLSSLRRPTEEDASKRTKTVRGVFGLLAWAGAVVAAFYAYDRAETWWLAIFVGLITLQVISRGLADVITDPQKVRRALYFSLQPALAVGSFYLAYRLWETWWLAFVVGFVGAAILNQMLAPLLFPRIHREEMADTKARWRRHA